MLDILKGFAGKHWFPLVAWMFPSMLAILAFWLFTLPIMTAAGWKIAVEINKLSTVEGAAWLAGGSIIIGVLLNTLSTPLYRLLEGYSWPGWLRRRAVAFQTKKYKELRRVVDRNIPGQAWERGLALEQLARFPSDPRQIAPTRLANAIRSFETYGKTRFNLDSQTLWTELCNSVSEDLRSEQELARAFVDLFVAMIYLGAAYAILMAITLIAVERTDPLAWSVVLVSVVIAAYSYRMAIIACDYWSITVQGLVNIGRKPLAELLGLQMPAKLADERVMWGLVTGFVFFGREDYGKKLDRFRIRSGGATKRRKRR